MAGSVVTGLYPPAHGTRTRHDTLTTSLPTIAEQFAAAGYETFGITSMGNVSSGTGFDRGFDEFYDLYKREDIIEKRGTSTAAREELKADEGAIALPRAADITDAFEEWLSSRQRDDPFFTFCWSIDPHIPYDPPAEYHQFRDPVYDGPVDGSHDCLRHVNDDQDRRQLKALYDEEIRYNDSCVGEMIDALRTANEYEDTLVCILGDHGEAFGEHGRLTHGHSPYDELVHVPWVVQSPGDVGGHAPTALTSLVDVAPTLLEYAGIEQGGVEPPVGGRSAAPALSGNSIEGHEQVFFETKPYDMHNAFYGVRTSDWKLIRIEKPERSARTTLELVRYVLEKGIVTDILRHPWYYWKRYRYDDGERLYDLETDPDERTDISGRNLDRRATLAVDLDDWLTACEKYRGTDRTGPMEVDERTKDQLRELGYVE